MLWKDKEYKKKKFLDFMKHLYMFLDDVFFQRLVLTASSYSRGIK